MRCSVTSMMNVMLEKQLRPIDKNALTGIAGKL